MGVLHDCLLSVTVVGSNQIVQGVLVAIVQASLRVARLTLYMQCMNVVPGAIYRILVVLYMLRHQQNGLNACSHQSISVV